jgi:hypothetical protein
MKVYEGNHKKWVGCKDLELEKMGGTSKIVLKEMQMDRPLIPTQCEQNLPIANFVNGAGLLNSNSILHGGQEVEKEIQVPGKDFEDTGTSPAGHLRSTMCLTMMLSLPIQLPPSTISALFNLVKIKILRIAICFQVG